MRSFIRHPTDIPIEIRFEDQSCKHQSLHDVSSGGLCFQYPEALPVGGIFNVHIALTSPPFDACCRVVWCQADVGVWQVGVEFLDQEDLFRLRMVEQICHIEQYRAAVRASQGRALSSHEAAIEWIEKYAESFTFPGSPPNHVPEKH
jgi:PilZ domain